MKKILMMSALAALAAAPAALGQTTGATVNPVTPPIDSPSANISRAGQSYGPVIILRSNRGRGLSTSSMRARRMPSRNINAKSANGMLRGR